MDNCSGKEIKAVMARYSETLFQGCKHFEELISETNDRELIKIYNTASLFFSISSLEGKLNEFISIQIAIDMEHKLPELRTIKREERQLSFDEKWDCVNKIFDYKKWDNSVEPFQSFNIIASLRNEIVHHKGNFLSKNETPTKKIRQLMKTLQVESKCDFIEDDCSSWVYDLFETKNLAQWITNKTQLLNEEIDKFWNKNPYI